MRRFAQLYESLDTTTSTRAKVEAMATYFAQAEAADAAWAIYVLIGRRFKRSVGPAQLRAWLYAEAGLPEWLVEETYAAVGDLAETIALLVTPDPAAAEQHADVKLAEWLESRIAPLAGLAPEERGRRIVAWWQALPYRECFLVNKLLTGALRVGVSRSLVTRALAEALDQPRVQIERALIGDWQPSAAFWQALRSSEGNLHVSHPYPFYLASPLEGDPRQLGDREEFLIEWKWDGIRGQIVRRAGTSSLWSRGEEVITERFPEIIAAAARLPDGTVIDGEVLAGEGDRILPFARLQQRVTRSKLTPKILLEIPARFVAYDVLELGGEDLRAQPLRARRAALADVLRETPGLLSLSPEVTESGWDAVSALREQSRARGVEGMMLKHWASSYGVGRQRGAWWKWKIDPFVFDGVLLYAAPGHGRRSNLFTDYTFGVWDGSALVPVAKAYSGLTNEEIVELDRWIRAHTKERFGTVRSVETQHVFELAYEGIAASSRHKSGIALRFPRITRWRNDKPAADADTLAHLRQVLADQQPHD